jgi:EmrB/QacA subfamily drug resistance transporter
VSDAAASVAPPRPVRLGLVLALCCTAQFMVILDVSIINIALPTIRSSLGFSATGLQWVVNAYTIAFAGLLMLGGRAADLAGQRLMFVVGLTVFALSSLAGGTALSSGMLIVARGAQGLGGALMAPASLAIITSHFAAGAERHRAVGLWGAMNGAGGATGVLLGGVITQLFSWRWILLINLPIGIIAALIAWRVIGERRSQAPLRTFDLAGALTLSGGLLAFVYGIVNAGAYGWGAVQSLGPIAFGLALMALFLRIEGHWAPAPLVPLRIFTSPVLRMANIIVLIFSAALFAMWYFASLYLQDVLHLTPIGAGLAFLPIALTIMACAPRAGRAVARYGSARVLGTGLTLLTIGLGLFARVAATGGYLGNFLLPAMFVAVGIGLSVVPSTIAATAHAAPGEAGLAAGLVNTSRQMGGALGIAALTTLQVQFANYLEHHAFQVPTVAKSESFELAFGLAAGLSATAALFAFRLLGSDEQTVNAAAAAPAAQTPPLAPLGPPAPAPPPLPQPVDVAPAPGAIPQPAGGPAPVPRRADRAALVLAPVTLTLPGGGSWALARSSVMVGGAQLRLAPSRGLIDS